MDKPRESTLPKPEIPGYSWRPVRREDAEGINKLLLAAEAVDQRGWQDTMEERQRDFEDPRSDYRRDAILAFAEDGELASLGWVFTMEAPNEWVSFLWGEVHPQHRGRGLGKATLRWMEARAQQVLLEKPADVPRVMRTGVPDWDENRIKLHEQEGFEAVRAFYRMYRDLSTPVDGPVMPPGVRLEIWHYKYNEFALEALNESFQDHWGFTPMTGEIWDLWHTGHPDFRPDLTYLAIVEDPKPDENPVAGLSINKVRRKDDGAPAENTGVVAELGVRRDWRRKGIGAALLNASLRAFKEAGLDSARLSVDTENLTGALRIYERVGFHVEKRFLTYMKKINESEDGYA